MDWLVDGCQRPVVGSEKVSCRVTGWFAYCTAGRLLGTSTTPTMPQGNETEILKFWIPDRSAITQNKRTY